jgi:hypothetical protein
MIKNWESLNVKYKGLIKTSRQDYQKLENWFDQIKNHICLQKEVQPRLLTLLVHQKLDAIYEENYAKNCAGMVLNTDPKKLNESWKDSKMLGKFIFKVYYQIWYLFLLFTKIELLFYLR